MAPCDVHQCEIKVVPLSFTYRVGIKEKEKEETQEVLPVFIGMCVCVGALAYVYYARIWVLLIQQCRPWIARAYCAWPTDPILGRCDALSLLPVLPSRLMCDVQAAIRCHRSSFYAVWRCVRCVVLPLFYFVALRTGIRRSGNGGAVLDYLERGATLFMVICDLAVYIFSFYYFYIVIVNINSEKLIRFLDYKNVLLV